MASWFERKILLREAAAFARQGLMMARPGPAYRAAGDEEGLTVFIHGYFATAGVFGAMAARLARSGAAARQLHFTYLPAGSVEGVTRTLAERIAVVRGGGPLNLIGHSMGGLIARYYCQILERPVDRLVCLATPHRGTQRARYYGALPLARELAPGSALLAALASTKDRLSGVRVCSVVAEGDAMIAPVDSAALEGHEVIRCADVGHQSMLLDSNVCEIVERILREPLSDRAEAVAPRLVG